MILGHCFSRADKAEPKMIETNKIGKISPLTKAEKIVVGIIFKTKSTICESAAIVVYCRNPSTERVVGSMFIPAPGLIKCATTYPITNARVVITSKYISILSPSRPISFISSIPTKPSTIVQKMIGPISILISLINPSPKGLTKTACSGKKCPKITAITTATMT